MNVYYYTGKAASFGAVFFEERLQGEGKEVPSTKYDEPRK
ncbi:hypothetical protein A33Q_4040 [Indibacter alkaliphilus LW1]|uniref:Uncharacterized protein n=1 Tax=Indibacter alkaliphilus (strain CCUG 57479 / KCTC 22604 / LW1) TaxID=1189612 RepID=S2CXP9_INDAL|nr:hypothetical protein A33Q_4040 [Indibacter alkaliphilus LW1]